MLPTSTRAMAADMIGRDYGDEFAKAVVVLSVGSWQGPVRSGYGLHLVRVNSKTAGRASTLSEARTAVERDWENERRTRAVDAYVAKLHQSYAVIVEAAVPGATKGRP